MDGSHTLSLITRAKLDTYIPNTVACHSCYTSYFAALSPPGINRLKFWVMLKRNASRYRADYSHTILITLKSIYEKDVLRGMSRIINNTHNGKTTLDDC